MKTRIILVFKFFLFLSSYQSFLQVETKFIKQQILNIPLQLKETFPYHLKKIISKSNVYILPLAFTTYGLIAIENDPLKQINSEFREEILEHHPYFKTKADNYLQFSPALMAFSMKMGGYKGWNNMLNSVKLYATSTLLMAGKIYAIKSTTKILRPDGSAKTSFPSGHTATAFAGAEFFHQKFKNFSPLLSYTGYHAATTTGALRMYNNKHYFSDVIAGAGIGT